MSEVPAKTVDARAEQLAFDRLSLALRNLKPHPFLMPIFALAICAIDVGSVPLATLLLWYAAFVLSLIPFWFVLKNFFKTERDASETRKWTLLAVASYALLTLVWSVQPAFLWAKGDDLNHLLMVLFLAGYLSAQSPFTAPSKALSATLFLIDGSALVLAPLREGGVAYDGVAFITFFYALYTLYMTRVMHESATNALSLKHDRSDLVVALANAKNESDRARQSAEAASRAKSHFLANMSHELRTPLNAILGFSEMIAHGSPALASKSPQYAEIIHKSGQHLLALINDILDLAKIEAGGLKLRESNVDGGRLMEDEATALMPRAEEGKVALKISFSPSVPPVFADERALKQIALNLLSNALKFTPPGGEITLFVEVSAGAALVFGVSDTGMGIAPEDQLRVFQNFGQGRHDVAEKGTGLGLPIVKGLAEAHGGNVILESAPGKGTKVTVFLPKERARPPTTSRAA